MLQVQLDMPWNYMILAKALFWIIKQDTQMAITLPELQRVSPVVI